MSRRALAEAEDMDSDRERFGGPITSAMLHTALLRCAHDSGRNPRDDFDLEQFARTVNSWLIPVKRGI